MEYMLDKLIFSAETSRGTAKAGEATVLLVLNIVFLRKPRNLNS